VIKQYNNLEQLVDKYKIYPSVKLIYSLTSEHHKKWRDYFNISKKKKNYFKEKEQWAAFIHNAQFI